MDIVLLIAAVVVGGVLGYVFRANIGDEFKVLHEKVDTLVATVKAKL